MQRAVFLPEPRALEKPDDATGSGPVRRGTGRKGSKDLARGLPYLRSRRRRRLTRQRSASNTHRGQTSWWGDRVIRFKVCFLMPGHIL